MIHGNQEPAENYENIGKTHNHQFEYIEPDKLIPYANNVKKHPQKQVIQIASSMKRYGFINAIIIDEHNEIIAGHGRYEAAKLLGLKQVPVMRVKNLTPLEIKAYRIADNQLTMNTGFDENLLKIDIKGLISLDPEFELETIGLETAQIDIILNDDTPEHDPADDVLSLDEAHIITKSGDAWNMGSHRLVCGDSRYDEAFKSLMMNESAHMCLTDPPFNVRVDGHVCG
ncbi:MAG: ParB/Srx family N-terminal domain-containing protein, partial [Pseudomonadota bacterium]